jgi:predicted metal-dependent phosphoesterase TrpH
MSTDPRRLNADLHCHSSRSDGVLEPAELARRAHANGVELFALTDHDELGGLAEASRVAAALGMRFVAGVEISVTWAGETVHVLGLGIDPDDGTLSEGLARTRAGRLARAREMAAQLETAGVPDAFDGALRHVGNPELISRTHFARHIVACGVCEHVDEVFDRFLVEGRPGFVPHRWAQLSEAMAWISRAGGVAVLAHPGRYRLNDNALWSLMSEFRDAGGEGIEVVCGSHTREQYDAFARHAREFGFRASRGSDFHGPGEGRFDLGRLPPLPASVVPLWHDWQ